MLKKMKKTILFAALMILSLVGCTEKLDEPQLNNNFAGSTM